jgi:hypothetical protein
MKNKVTFMMIEIEEEAIEITEVVEVVKVSTNRRNTSQEKVTLSNLVMTSPELKGNQALRTIKLLTLAMLPSKGHPRLLLKTNLQRI